MAKSAWNGIRDGVYHDNARCSAASSIPRREVQAGTGGKPKCPNCARLDRAGDRFNAAKGAGVIISVPDKRVRTIKEQLSHTDRRGPHG